MLKSPYKVRHVYPNPYRVDWEEGCDAWGNPIKYENAEEKDRELGIDS